MDLSHDQFALLERLFFELEALDAADREQRLAELDSEDPVVAGELRRMLSLDPMERRSVVDLLRTGGPRLGTGAPDIDRVGSYRILRRLGEGGMGVVYEAEQMEPIRRRVALKLIRGGLDSREVVRRFEAERQTLALMDHPGVARVFEAGSTEAGWPYFAMELVDGVPIVDYCDSAQLNTRERLTLIVEACRAVQHAHRRGVIHRDLKPSNILVTEVEGRPQVKIIDFGIAKAVAEGEGREPGLTRIGGLVGTPEYMSPEQLRGGEIDTRSDVYALGVLLFEVLTGLLPVPSEELRTWSLDEMGRRLAARETPRPSEQILTGTEEGRTAALQRGTSVGTLVRELRGDLDWIVLKALEKDVDRRYDSPSELAADLERFMVHEPVSAGPPSIRYRARKFLRRHRLATLVAGAILVAILLGFVGLVVGLDRARAAEAVALREAEVRREVLEFMSGLFTQGAQSAEQGQNLSVPQLFERALEQVDTRPPSDPLVYGTVLNRLGEFFFMGLKDVEQADEVFRRAEAILRGADEAGSELATSLYVLGSIERVRGHLDEAFALQNEALDLRSRAEGTESGGVAAVLSEIAQLERARGELDEAVETMRRSIRIAEQNAETPDRDIVSKKLILAGMLPPTGEESAQLHAEVLELSRELGLKQYESIALNNQGRAELMRGDFATARARLQEALAIISADLQSDPIRIQVLHSNLGMIAARLGRYDEATAQLSASLDRIVETYGLESPAGAAVSQLLGEAYLRGGMLPEARRHLLQGLDLARRVPAEAPPVSVLRAELKVALLEEAEGDVAGARARLERALEQEADDDEGRCLLLYERARLAADIAGARAWAARADNACPDDGKRPSILYHRAGFLARHGQRASALGLLGEIATLGMRDTWPASDPRFGSLHGDPQFQEIVERMRPRPGGVAQE